MKVTHDENKDENGVVKDSTRGTELSLDAKVIFEAQQRHGLRHEDYQRYCTYCTKRLHKLRKSLKLCCYYVGKKFVMPEIVPEKISEIRFLYIPLFEAERAWAYSIELKRETNTEPRKRFQQLRRLKRAVKHASTLKMLSDSSNCDARTKLECQCVVENRCQNLLAAGKNILAELSALFKAYSSSMQGLLWFELENWQKALDLFTQARHIYERLCNIISDGDEKSIYKRRTDEFLPNIRYCAYHIGDKSAFDDLVNMRLNATGETFGLLEALLNETLQKQSEMSTEVEWNNRKIAVRNKQIRLFLLNLNEMETKKSQSADSDMKLKCLDSILKEITDALQVLRDELKSDNNFHALQRGNIQVAEPFTVNFLCFCYLTHYRLLRAAERDLLLIYEASQGKAVSKASKPQDIARLYEHIGQNLNDMKNVPLLSNDEQFIRQCDLLIKVIRAQRVLTISQAFAMSSKFKESAAFLLKAKTLALEALNDDTMNEKISDLLPNVDMRPILKSIVEKCEADELSLRLSAFIEPVETDKNGKVSSLPIIEELDENNLCFDLSSVPELVRIPPCDFRAIPCKPVLFDLAYENIAFPSLLNEIKSDETAKESKGGFTDFVKGLWSWAR